MDKNSWPRAALVFPEHYADAAAVLGRAFVNDPLVNALAPEPREPVERARCLAGLFAVVLKLQRRDGQPVFGVFDAGRLIAAAVVEGTMHASAGAAVASGLLNLPAMVRAVGWAGVQRSIKLLDTLTRNHPPRPHLYLNILGVEPSFQGRHCGIAILNHLRELVEARSDLDGVYLETATEANVAYYTRNGFEVIGEFYPLGVRMWRMFQARRDPSPATRRAEGATA
ncbi:MAG TPA: GNAT family N-acetyltransferase [Candidatus Binataceae bacterium]|jgi:ribosomal protein S18 acetylase RimI-like enzyme|nr:GNAT family N-acetyltransferase [Candidatus Binataceae bacterium]